MMKKNYMIPLLRMIPVRSEYSFLATTDSGIGDWEKDPDSLDF